MSQDTSLRMKNTSLKTKDNSSMNTVKISSIIRRNQDNTGAGTRDGERKATDSDSPDSVQSSDDLCVDRAEDIGTGLVEETGQ